MEYLHKLVDKNKFKKALDYLLSNFSLDEDEKNEIRLLASQLDDIKKKELLNLYSIEKINIEKNKIRLAILFYGNRYKENQETPSSKKENTPYFNYEKFIGMGNEPGWKLQISTQNIIFISDYGTKTNAYEITNQNFGTDIWHFKSNKPLFLSKRPISISIIITKETSFDDMSGEEYPYKVEITEDFRHYIGVGKIKE